MGLVSSVDIKELENLYVVILVAILENGFGVLVRSRALQSLFGIPKVPVQPKRPLVRISREPDKGERLPQIVDFLDRRFRLVLLVTATNLPTKLELIRSMDYVSQVFLDLRGLDRVMAELLTGGTQVLNVVIVISLQAFSLLRVS